MLHLTTKLDKSNEFGIPYIEVIRIHGLCIQAKSLEIIEYELQKIVESGNDINKYVNPFGCNLLFL